MSHHPSRAGVRLAAALGAAAGVLGGPRMRRRSAAAPRLTGADGARGTVILPFGRYFAGWADLLTREGFKTVAPIDGISPFSGVGDPDPEMQCFADGERVNGRVRIDVRKDLAVQMARADAQFLAVENSTALLLHREVNGRLYTVLAGEETDLMNTLWNADPEQARRQAFKVSYHGLTDRLRAAYDAFVRACLDSFDPARIILIRSHVPRFWVADDGTIAPTNVDRRDARFLEALDAYFVEQTGCRLASGTLRHFPSDARWHTVDHRLRRAMEEDLVALCSLPGGAGPGSTKTAPAARREPSAADHVVGAARGNRAVDWGWLRRYFAVGGVSYDDLLALAYLEQRDADGDEDLIRRCVQRAVADRHSYPLTVTRQGFDRSLQALRRWRWRSLKLPRGRLWAPQITAPCGSVVFRFLGDGSIQRIPVSRVTVSEAEAVVDGRLPITPLNLSGVLGSWPVYLERGRRGITAAPRVVVSDVNELVDTCSWIDWATVLDNERFVITTPDRDVVPAVAPEARTDLSFIFDPNARIVTVSGGLMDQVTRIALFDDLCWPHGFDLYFDDLLYAWRRKFNGFEASRLAPQVERRRITRLVSQALIESFRDEVMKKTKLPWAFIQSRAWYDLGLREATVVTRDHVNSRRLMEIGHEFPVRVVYTKEELGELIREPPSPICFNTTPQRIPIVPESAAAIRRVFSYGHLEATGLDPDVARTAELLRSAPHVAFHVRRGDDYLHPLADPGGWHAQRSHYSQAVGYLIETELKTSDFDVAVFSDDLDFVEAHLSDYGLDRVSGQVRFIQGNNHFKSIYDSYLMSLCPLIVGSVGHFASTTSLLADPPSVFIRARPEAVRVEWRR
jgi:hypothetical protein